MKRAGGAGVVGQIVAPLAFFFSCYALSRAWQDFSITFFGMVKIGLPSLGMLTSLAYLLGSLSFLLSPPDDDTHTPTPSTKSLSTHTTHPTSEDIPTHKSHTHTSNATRLFTSTLSNNGTRVPPKTSPAAGETIIIVGAGTAGAAAAVGLGDRGFKVVLVERDMSLQDRIVGELLQPGGLRALERLGLDECAKEGIDSVGVEGYVVFTPNKKGVAVGGAVIGEEKSKEEEEKMMNGNGKAYTHTHTHTHGESKGEEIDEDDSVKDILLKYPSHDPASISEYFGLIDPPSPSPSPSTDTHTHTPSSPSSPANTHTPTQPLAPKGRSFHNGRFVQRLRERCVAHPNITIIEGIVTKLLHSDTHTQTHTHTQPQKVVGIEYKVETGNTLTHTDATTGEVTHTQEKVTKQALAPLTIIADGLWSSLRTHVDKKAKPTQISSFVGLIITHPPHASPLPHTHHGHVVLAEPSPVLLYQISSTETRVLVDIHGKMPSASNGELHTHMLTHILPQLPDILQGPFREAVESGQVKSMPNRAMPCAKIDKDGVLLLGDALNMRHPLTGGGMTVALRDVEAVCYLLEEIETLTDTHTVRKVKKTFARQRKDWAATINVLANALHAVFSTPGGDSTRKDLRDACFDYLSLGGSCAGGPINLLSGLTPRPSILALHFFLVAFHGVGKYLKPFPTPKKLGRMYDMLHVACRIIMPMLTVERSTVLASWPMRMLISLLFPYGDGI